MIEVLMKMIECIAKLLMNKLEIDIKNKNL